MTTETTKERWKGCYCHTCGKDFHSLGIMSHRAAHRRRKENCKITFSNNDTYTYKYGKRAA